MPAASWRRLMRRRISPVLRSTIGRDRVADYQIKQQRGDALDAIEIGLGYDPSKRC